MKCIYFKLKVKLVHFAIVSLQVRPQEMQTVGEEREEEEKIQTKVGMSFLNQCTYQS